MNKTELLSMLVRDLKALAKKLKIVIPERTKKADIVGAILTAARGDKKSEAGKTASKKTAAKKIASKKAAPAKAAAEVQVRTPKKQPVPKRAPTGKAPEPVAAVHNWKIPPGTEEPLLAQERVAESKYYTGPAQHQAVAERGELPRTYDQDRIMLMTRDPFVVHAYWDVAPARLEREKAWFGWGSKLSVRIYDITGVQFDGSNALAYVDQEVEERTGNWYFDLGRPSHSFCADLGLLSPEGRFLTIARSNYITTPRDGASDVIDEEWMIADEEFWKLYGFAEGIQGGLSSPGRGLQEKESARRKRLHEMSSLGLYQRERARARRK
jgi:hypothetical protein